MSNARKCTNDQIKHNTKMSRVAGAHDKSTVAKVVTPGERIAHEERVQSVGEA